MKNTLIILHLAAILLLTIITSFYIQSFILLYYLVFTVIFMASTYYSLKTVIEYRTGSFYYLLNILFLLGFWFKYSVQKITLQVFREPIGTFLLNSESEVKVLWVIICGMIGFLLAQLFSTYIFKQSPNIRELEKKVPFDKKALIIILITASLMALINIKFNIMLFGLQPTVLLPFKGNVIFFLALTRGIIFLFFFYCFRNYSNKNIFWGALITTICSIGVLSRMVILLSFSVFFILLLQEITSWSFIKALKNISILLLFLALFSVLTVVASTKARNKIYFATFTQLNNLATNDVKTKSLTEKFNYNSKFDVFLDMALGRWIGIEGVMAVESFPTKSFSFFKEALNEKSYHGMSFYTQIAEPYKYKNVKPGPIISTSVPGPIAFFYYTGSILFVFFATFLSTFSLSAIEQLVFKYFHETRSVAIYVSTFLVFDFFQFGISPMACARYWGFSFFCIAVFYMITNKLNILKRESK